MSTSYPNDGDLSTRRRIDTADQTKHRVNRRGYNLFFYNSTSFLGVLRSATTIQTASFSICSTFDTCL